MDQQSALRNRNKGVELCAIVRDEQERFWRHDPSLQAALDDTYSYMTKHLDPVLSKAIEEVLLYQPDQTADFLAQFLRGTLNPKKFTYVNIKRQQYFDRKVRHLVALGMNSAVVDRPEDPTAYLAEFFEARTKFY
ncbi:hypothetical protein PybrP1_007145 [[Pythium] brassicae (nom. inval.)]|nr:hypothetical protein PybrP1_007145 [[Pythium] brassicae (nom. inval.)]